MTTIPRSRYQADEEIEQRLQQEHEAQQHSDPYHDEVANYWQCCDCHVLGLRRILLDERFGSAECL